MERHLASIGTELPRFGEGRADLEVGVEAGQRLEELGRDGRAPGISLGGRIESGRASSEDPDGAIRTGGRLPSTRGEQRRSHEEDEQTAHRREYRAGRR